MIIYTISPFTLCSFFIICLCFVNIARGADTLSVHSSNQQLGSGRIFCIGNMLKLLECLLCINAMGTTLIINNTIVKHTGTEATSSKR